MPRAAVALAGREHEGEGPFTATVATGIDPPGAHAADGRGVVQAKQELPEALAVGASGRAATAGARPDEAPVDHLAWLQANEDQLNALRRRHVGLRRGDARPQVTGRQGDGE